MAEQIERCAPAEDLRVLRLQNVVNGRTYESLVISENGRASARQDADFGATPLGRFTARILAALQLLPGDTRATLTPMGHLHVETRVETRVENHVAPPIEHHAVAGAVAGDPK